MNFLKKIRSIAILMLVLGFLFSGVLVSCDNKSKADGTEHPAAEDEAEHPAGESEHPTEDENAADTTATEPTP